MASMTVFPPANDSDWRKDEMWRLEILVPVFLLRRRDDISFRAFDYERSLWQISIHVQQIKPSKDSAGFV
jgi:hypothetical protein